MTKLVLAPLADFTDAPFRLMCFEGGADMAYTEMVSAAALAHGHRQSLELMETMAGEGVVGCQLFGSNPEELAFATDLASKHNPRFAEVNLNAGCPMAKVTRSGSGAKLVESPESIDEDWRKAVLKSAVEHVLTKTALSDRDRNVYREYALEGRDIGEVAAKYKISRNYVSQIKIRIDKRIVAVGQSLVAGDGESL